MRSWFVLFCLLSLPCGLSAAAIPDASPDAASSLRDKLAGYEKFTAHFSQTVTDEKGKVIQKGEGKLAIARPGKFFWQLQGADEELIVSNGQTLWHYTPFLEQVTIMSLSQALRNTPFLLLSQPDSELWAQYHIEMQAADDGVEYRLQQPDGQDALFTVGFTNQGVLKGFAFKEKGGSNSSFAISELSRDGVKESDFQFTVPDGTDIDDQR